VSNHSILVLDNARYIVQIVSFNLRKKGFRVLETYSGEEALDTISRDQVDLVILDVLLSGINGFEVCKRIKDNPDSAHIPVIILTAKGQEFDRQRGHKMGADVYMTKPFSPRRLVEKVTEILSPAERVEE